MASAVKVDLRECIKNSGLRIAMPLNIVWMVKDVGIALKIIEKYLDDSLTLVVKNILFINSGHADRPLTSRDMP